MFRPIAISLSPNTEKDDVLLALKLLFSPWQWKEGKYVEKLEKKFAEYLGVKYAISFNSGRVAELAILKCLGVGEDDEILLQAFTCVVVPNSVFWLGARPIYVDISEDKFNMSPSDLEKKIPPSSKAIIVQHTFGQPADMDKILKIARQNNLIIIEDCAHALGAKYKGELAGRFGKAAFFSFGRDKVISSVFGGIAVTNDNVLGERLKNFQKNLHYPSSFWIFQQLLHPLTLNLIVLPFYNFFAIGKLVLFCFQKLGLLSFPVEKKERLGKKPKIHPAKFANALTMLAYHQLGKLEKFNQKRLQTAKIYERELKKLSIKLPKIESGSIVFRYTIRMPQALQLYQFAKHKGVLLGNWYSNVIDPKGVDFDKIGYKIGSCPIAEKVAQEVINLPTYPRMTEKDALRVVRLIKEYTRLSC